MNKINLVEWDILTRVYFCLYQTQNNFHVVVTNIDGIVFRITVTDSNGNRQFSIDNQLNIESYDSNKSASDIANCFKENGIHALC